VIGLEGRPQGDLGLATLVGTLSERCRRLEMRLKQAEKTLMLLWAHLRQVNG
jgi:hypothetical protein